MASSGFAYRILVVDDDPRTLQTSVLVLESKGYEVQTADGGFHALAKLRQALPDLIISGLSMPNMSGFEFLSIVRRRFPQIPVIVISGAYEGSPEGLIADAFFSQARYSPEELFSKIAGLIVQAPIRANVGRPSRAPVWVPLNDTGYFVVTCTECLRSFSVLEEEATSELHETECIFCNSKVRYLADPIKRKRPSTP